MSDKSTHPAPPLAFLDARAWQQREQIGEGGGLPMLPRNWRQEPGSDRSTPRRAQDRVASLTQNRNDDIVNRWHPTSPFAAVKAARDQPTCFLSPIGDFLR